MFNSVFHWNYCAPAIFPWYSHPYIYFISLFGSGSSLHPPNIPSSDLYPLSSLVLENTCSLAHTEYWSCASCVCITWWNAVLQLPLLYIQKYYQFIIIYQYNYLSNQKKKLMQLLTPYYGTFKEFFSLRQKVYHLLIKLRNRIKKQWPQISQYVQVCTKQNMFWSAIQTNKIWATKPFGLEEWCELKYFISRYFELM